MDEKAKEARNEYNREWYKKNKEKRKESTARYWQKKADQVENENNKDIPDQPK